MIAEARAQFINAKQRLEHSLATTPEDRLNWSPSESSRTPLQVAAHAAMAVRMMHGNLIGETFEIPDPDVADRMFREQELRFRSREEVLALLEENSSCYLEWLDTVDPSQLNNLMELPFGFPPAPLSAGISFMPAHLQYHCAQIDYIQTIYGDRDWHLN